MSELIQLNELGEFPILSASEMSFTDSKNLGSRLLLPINAQQGEKQYEKTKECYMLDSFSKSTLYYDENAARRQIKNYNPVYTYNEKTNPSPIFDYGLIIPTCAISGTRDYSTLIDYLYPIESGSGDPLPRPNPPTYTGLLVDISNASQYDRVSQVADYSEIEDMAGNKRYCGVKLDAVSAGAALPFSELQNGSVEIPALITNPAPPRVDFQFFFADYDNFYCNPVLGIMRSKGVVYIPLRVRKWSVDENKYNTTDIDFPVTVYLSARFYSSIPSFSVTNSFIENDAIKEITYSSGAVVTQPFYYRATLHSFRDEWKALFIYSGQGGTCIGQVEGKGYKLVKQLFRSTSLPRVPTTREFILSVMALGEFYPLNFPYWLGGDAALYPPAPLPREGISIPKINAEFIYPNIETGDVYLIGNSDGRDYAFSSYGFGPYTVLFSQPYNGTSDLSKNIYFILRDGGGYYKVDISDIIGDKNLSYGGYDNGFVLLGLTDNTDVINYVMLQVDIPRPKLNGKVQYDFKKIGISFIPCQTHCMGQGGILSKY